MNLWDNIFWQFILHDRCKPILLSSEDSWAWLMGCLNHWNQHPVMNVYDRSYTLATKSQYLLYRESNNKKYVGFKTWRYRTKPVKWLGLSQVPRLHKHPTLHSHPTLHTDDNFKNPDLWYYTETQHYTLMITLKNSRLWLHTLNLTLLRHW